MNMRALFDDDEAVSPVIGVILMVAITVILAAVIAGFVLNLGEETQTTTPQASFSFDYSDEGQEDADSLTITHESGDTIDADRVELAVDDIRANDDDGSEYSDNVDIVSSNGWSDVGSSGDITAGTSITLNGDVFEYTGSTGDSGLLNGASGEADRDTADSHQDTVELQYATVRVVYIDAETGSSTTLATWEGPEA